MHEIAIITVDYDAENQVLCNVLYTLSFDIINMLKYVLVHFFWVGLLYSPSERLVEHGGGSNAAGLGAIKLDGQVQCATHLYVPASASFTS